MHWKQSEDTCLSEKQEQDKDLYMCSVFCIWKGGNNSMYSYVVYGHEKILES